MTTERAAVYRALVEQTLFNADFFAVRGRQGDKAIANRFYNLIPLIADLKKADRAEENDMSTTDIGLRDQVAKLLADRIGHGLREKTESVAAEVVALLTAAGEAQAPRVRHSCETDMLSDCPGCMADAAQLQATAPAGMVLVPREPTGNMNDEGEREIAFGNDFSDAWKAAIAAAPAAQVARVTEPMVSAMEKTGDDLIERMERHQERVQRLFDKLAASQVAVPIPMILLCPACGKQHIDAPETRDVPSGDGFAEVADWTNPPHRSHLCHACGCIWRPADVPTVGVERIESRGSADTWDVAAAPAVVIDLGQVFLDAINKAVAENTWMPAEYVANDWQADVIDYLRNGPDTFAAAPEGAQATLPFAYVSPKGGYCDATNSTNFRMLLEGAKQGASNWPDGATLLYTAPPSQDAEDAARYRLIRSRINGSPVEWDRFVQTLDAGEDGQDSDAFDRCIDAARAAEGDGNG